MIQNCVTSYISNDLTPMERIFKIWVAVFFFRVWRSYIKKSPNLKMDVFVSSNAYSCIEINAHAIVSLTRILKQNNTPSAYFIPVLYSSQTCENFFRIMRSMTSTHCTMVNFSILERLHRLKRLQVQNQIMNSEDEMHGFHFPSKKHVEYNETRSLRNDSEIIAVIENAKQQVATIFKDLNIVVIENDFLSQIRRVETLEKKTRTRHDSNESDISDFDSETEETDFEETPYNDPNGVEEISEVTLDNSYCARWQ